MLCYNFVTSVMYCYKILGIDNTMSWDDESNTVQPKPRYQLQNNTQSFESISLSSRSLRQYHQMSRTPPSSNTTPTKSSDSGYTISTVHKIPFGGLINAVRMLSHQLSHHHCILYCELHPYTTWKSTVPLRKFRSLMKGQVPFLWGNSRQLFQLWFVNWSSSMVLITLMRSHSNNWPIMCTMRH